VSYLNIEKFDVEGPLLLTPRVFGDDRGFFFESWNQSYWIAQLEQFGQQQCSFVQDNHSRSSHGVLRGLHYQLPPHAQGKLVRCVLGEIFDVAVDIRRGSTSFGGWVAANLSAENKQQLWIPAGFAHGFLTISEQAEVLYKTTDFWSKQSEQSIRWDDPTLAIKWPLQLIEGSSAQLSEKDDGAPLLALLHPDLLFP